MEKPHVTKNFMRLSAKNLSGFIYTAFCHLKVR